MINIMRCAMAGLLCCAVFFAARAEATVVIDGTRVVYPSKQSEVTVQLENKGQVPALMQIWLDAGDERATPEKADVPFAITPPLFRLDGGKSGTVRVMYTGQPLPSDKESLFWLNVLEVPPKSTEEGRNMLQFAFRTRIKVLFRPAGLPGNPARAPYELTWKLVDGKNGKGVALQATNPTPYYVNFAEVGVKLGDRDISEQGGGMVAPGSTAEFPISKLASRPSGDVKAQVKVISDFGAVNTIVQPLAP